jgi:hypothetical protein
LIDEPDAGRLAYQRELRAALQATSVALFARVAGEPNDGAEHFDMFPRVADFHL